MKTNHSLVVLLFLLTTITFGQTKTTDLLPVKIDGLFGFIALV